MDETFFKLPLDAQSFYLILRIEGIIDAKCFRKSGDSYTVSAVKHVVYHSPYGLNFGNNGNSAADMALSILAHYFEESLPKNTYLIGRDFSEWAGNSRAFKLHKKFRDRFLVVEKGDALVITQEQIVNWLNKEAG